MCNTLHLLSAGRTQSAGFDLEAGDPVDGANNDNDVVGYNVQGCSGNVVGVSCTRMLDCG